MVAKTGLDIKGGGVVLGFVFGDGMVWRSVGSVGGRWQGEHR